MVWRLGRHAAWVAVWLVAAGVAGGDEKSVVREGQEAETAAQPAVETGGFSGNVNALSFSPDGRYLAGAGADGTVRIWDLEDGRLVHVLRGYKEPWIGWPLTLEFSPSGQELVVGLWDPTDEAGLRVYRLDDLSRIDSVVPGFQGGVRRLAFSRDGLYLACAEQSGRIRVLHWPTRKEQSVIPGSEEVVYLGFPGSVPLLLRELAAGGDVWNAVEGRAASELEKAAIALRTGSLYGAAQRSLPALGDHVKALTVLRYEQGRILLGGQGRREGRDVYWAGVWKDGQEGPVTVYDKHRYLIKAVALDAAGKRAATGDMLGDVDVWDTSTGERLYRFRGNSGPIYRVGFCDEDGALGLGRTPNPPGRWTFNSYAEVDQAFDLKARGVQLRKPEGVVRTEAVESGPWRLQLRTVDGETVLESTRGGRPAGRTTVGSPYAYGVVATPGGGHLALVTTLNGGALMLDLETMQQVGELLDPGGPVTSFSQTADGKWLVTSSTKGIVRFYRVEAPRDWGLVGLVMKDQPDGRGAVVKDVPEGSPEAQAGVRAGDLLTKVDGLELKEVDRLREAGKCPFRSGQEVTLSLERDGRELAARVRLVREPDMWLADLSLLISADSREWVMWTPQGYYDASPAGDRMMGWHVNAGRAEAARFDSAYQYRKRFYRPDVIDRLLGGETIERAVELADRDRPRSEGLVDVRNEKTIERLAPPLVRIVEPANGLRTAEARVKVRYEVEARGSSPVREVMLRINGRPPGARDIVREEAAQGGKTAYSQEVTLQPGRNEVSVVATTGESESAPVSVRVERVVAGGPGGGASGKLYVLAVGVSKYANADYTLDYAAKDAQDFAAAWGAQKGRFFEAVETRLLLDEGATAASIRKAMGWLENEAKAEDVVILFLSAHGYRDPRRNYWLVAHDFDLKDLRNTAIPFTDFGLLIRNVPSKLLIFTDTCHSGGLADAQQLAGDDPTREFVSEEAGAVLVSSSTARQPSLESAEWGHGAFTKAILEVLGAKDGEAAKDGYLSVMELGLAVSNRVRELTEERQQPVVANARGVPDYRIARIGEVTEEKAEPAVARTKAEELAEAGFQFLKRNEVAKALEALNEAIEMDPALAIAYSRRASAEASSGDLIRARADMEEAVRLAPEDALVRANRAMLLASLNQLEAARAEAERAVALDGKSSKAYTVRGLMEFRANEPEKAAADFEKAIALDGTNTVALRFRAGLRLAMKQVEEAQADYDEAIRRDPEDFESYFARGVFRHFTVKDLDGAMADYRNAVKLNPMASNTWMNLGFIHRERGQIKDAVDCFSRAIDAWPRNAMAYLDRSNTYVQAGRLNEALEDASKAVQLDPRTAENLHNRGIVYLMMRLDEWAVADFTEAIRLDAKAVKSYRLRALARVLGGIDPDAALADLDEAETLQREPDSERDLYRGMALYEKGEDARAVALMRKALAASPEQWSTLGQLAWILSTSTKAEVRNGAEALALARKAVELSKGQFPYGVRVLACALAETGNMGEAIRTLQSAPAEQVRPWALGVPGPLLMASFEAGQPYRQDGRSYRVYHLLNVERDARGAIALLDQVIGGDAERSEAYYQRAIAHVLLGEAARAIQDAERCVELAPELPDARVYLAMLLASASDPALRDPARAIEHARKACELTGWKSADAMVALAKGQYAAGQTAAAVETLQRALGAQPGHVEAQSILRGLETAAPGTP